MSPQDKTVLRKAYVALSAYYRTQIPDGTIDMYVEDLESFELMPVLNAISKYRKDFRNRNVPLPAHIAALINPEPTSRDLAEITLDKVMNAIRCFGYMGSADARATVGEVAWRIIQRMGGWYAVCTDPNFNPGVFRAQFLNSAESLHRIAGVTDLGKFIESRQAKEFEIEQKKSEAIKQLGTIKDINEVIK